MMTTPSIIPGVADNGEGGERLLTTAQAAQYLRLASSTLNKWRVYGTGPKFIKLGRAVRYRHTDLDAFLASQSRLSTTSQGTLS
ncbi:helix-turn-helix transcriptional regulator [Kordiimonas pumila]|uniref:Helix-turn-helix transcriptional regulator n=1 Tax=Kordiimonas pumila TaxID=2161677 RepID=A0ABV7D851_9PROT|nr:helix-turn-helix domain-containing protein [Kordiimonas pumila]